MAKCVRIDETGAKIVGWNFETHNNEGKQISKNIWHKSTWNGKTENYYLISDNANIEHVQDEANK